MFVAYAVDKKYLIAFGKNLKRIRLEKNISQSALAYECDMEISQISRMERGVINTSIYNLFLISKVFKIAPKELLDFEF